VHGTSRRTLLAASIGLLGAVPVIAHAQPTPADDMSLESYLELLAQIAPAARSGAEAWLQAIAARCGHRPGSTELRRAIGDGNGDPVLMGMVRASAQRDTAALAQWAQRIDCGARR
jgi:hypothetical protein